jgi:hypothetical protein
MQLYFQAKLLADNLIANLQIRLPSPWLPGLS